MEHNRRDPLKTRHKVTIEKGIIFSGDIIVSPKSLKRDVRKFTMLLLYILWYDRPSFMISNKQLLQKLEYNLLKPDCHSWGISKIQSDSLEERYAIKFCFKVGKMLPQKRMECFRLLLEHLACIEHQSLSGIRDSRKAGSLWVMKRGVGGVRKSIDQSWLAKVLGSGLGLLCWGFKGVQEKIPWEEASTLQIGSMGFPLGPVYNSILVTDYFTKMGIKSVPHPPNSPDLAPCAFCLFPKPRSCRYETIEEMKEAVTKVTDTQEDFYGAWQKLLDRYN